MSKLIQKGAACALRTRSMSSAADLNKLTPEQLQKWSEKINPAQSVYGEKNPSVEKWQKFFQDPLNCEKPMYRRKGASDDMILAGLSLGVGGIFLYNVADFLRR